MLRLKKEHSSALKGPVYASLTLACSSLGDAFLYPFLPLSGQHIGVPFAWVGILLSANRFVRIFTNGIVVRLFVKFNTRKVIVAAAIVAVISTAGYGIVTGLFSWILIRVMWGFSYSALRIGSASYAIDHARPGLALGISRSIHEAGPMFALIIAPLLLNHFTPPATFILLALLSLPAIFFGLLLPEVAVEKTNSSFRVEMPSTFNLLTFITALLMDGIIIVLLGLLIHKVQTDYSILEVAAAAAFYLAYRRLCFVLLSPVVGWLADKIGFEKVFDGSVFFILIGLGAVSMQWISVGAVLVFTAYSFHTAVSPALAAASGINGLQAVASNVTWRDLGAATGTLIGGFMLHWQSHTYLFLILTFVLTILWFIHGGFFYKIKLTKLRYGGSKSI